MSGTLVFVSIFSGVWGLLGAIFLAVGLGMGRGWRRREERLRASADATVVEVVRHTHHSSDGDSTSWNPLVEFVYEGRRITLEAQDSVSRKKYYEGQQVRILYDPDDPASFRIEGENGARTVHVVFTVVGAVCLLIALAAVVIGFLANPETRWLMKYRWFRH